MTRLSLVLKALVAALALPLLFIQTVAFGQTGPDITIGETNSNPTGSLTDYGNRGLLLAQSCVLSQSATLESLSFYVLTPGGQLTLGIYSDSGGIPNTLLAYTSTFTPIAGWNTQSVVTPLTLSPGTYWLAYMPSSSLLTFKFESGGTFEYQNQTFGTGALPSTMAPTYTGSGHWSFYANLAPTATSPPVTNTGFQFWGGVFDVPNTNFNLYINNPYNGLNQPSQGGLATTATTTINQFNWTPFDNAVQVCRANNLKLIIYMGFGSWDESQGFPANYGYSGSNLKTWFTNWVSQMATMYPDLANFCYFNYCNEGLTLNKSGTGNWEAAFGGAGATGVDWIINTGKVVRQYFPTAKIGINDFNYEDSSVMPAYGGGASQLPYVLSKLPYLISAGVLDWIGMEGYSLETQTSAGLTGALNQVGQLGVKVIYTEFSPGSYYWFWIRGLTSDPPQNADATWSDGLTSQQGSHQSNQVAAWKRLAPLFATNPNCIGITGPWVGTPAGGAPIFTGNPSTDLPAMTWLKSYAPTVLGK